MTNNQVYKLKKIPIREIKRRVEREELLDQREQTFFGGDDMIGRSGDPTENRGQKPSRFGGCR